MRSYNAWLIDWQIENRTRCDRRQSVCRPLALLWTYLILDWNVWLLGPGRWPRAASSQGREVRFTQAWSLCCFGLLHKRLCCCCCCSCWRCGCCCCGCCWPARCSAVSMHQYSDAVPRPSQGEPAPKATKIASLKARSVCCYGFLHGKPYSCCCCCRPAACTASTMCSHPGCVSGPSHKDLIALSA